MKFFSPLLALLGAASCVTALVSKRVDSAGGLDFVYPYPVKSYRFVSQRKQLTMSYMDVSPVGARKGNIVLLHGKNFCGATWDVTIKVLVRAGYRVIVPDQIGFCKSTKPSEYQFTLFALAQNTNALLNSIGVTSAIIMGHSMGGMLSARYALMYPAQTSRLVMVDPLGLENWFELGVPYQAPDLAYTAELASTFNSLKTYQQSTYYAGTWDPSYDVWINMLFSIYNGTLGDHFAWNMAMTTDMVFTQPVIEELPNLKMPSLLIVGDKDTTAIGSKWAPANIKPLLGHYDVLGPMVAAQIPGCTYVHFPLLGHAPQIQDPVSFHKALLSWLP
ncbi:related to hydrolase [Rhynchosporium agropyri]|uniref:Related to hydrolase n=1 Tax=Rhynchosporium agropyri TaxID=914238 RepID=A0A1E1LQA7_9HELO|nr:related to hydrolase [Rhynchosporium agropyri]